VHEAADPGVEAGLREHLHSRDVRGDEAGRGLDRPVDVGFGGGRVVWGAPAAEFAIVNEIKPGPAELH